MKKTLTSAMMILCVIAIAVPGFAKSDKASQGKVNVCHFTGGGHAADMDFRLPDDKDSFEYEYSEACCEVLGNSEEYGKTIIIQVADRGWENGHKGSPDSSFAFSECLRLVEVQPDE